MSDDNKGDSGCLWLAVIVLIVTVWGLLDRTGRLEKAAHDADPVATAKGAP